MEDRSPDTRTPKAPADDWRPRFLDALRDTGNVRLSCDAAGKSRSWVYEVRGQDAAFAEEWDAALEDACDTLETVARKRATEGVVTSEEYDAAGELVKKVTKYSDTLLIFLLKGARPDKYRERIDARHSGPDGGPIQFAQVDLSLYTDDEIADLERLALRAAGQAAESAGDPPGDRAEEVPG